MFNQYQQPQGYQVPQMQLMNPQEFTLTLKLAKNWEQILGDSLNRNQGKINKKLLEDMANSSPQNIICMLVASMSMYPIVFGISKIAETYRIDMALNQNNTPKDLIEAINRDKYLSEIIDSMAVNGKDCGYDPIRLFAANSQSTGFDRIPISGVGIAPQKQLHHPNELRNIAKRELVEVWDVLLGTELEKMTKDDIAYLHSLKLSTNTSIMAGNVTVYYTVVKQISYTLVRMDTIKIVIAGDRQILSNELVDRTILPNTTIVVDKETKVITLETIA